VISAYHSLLPRAAIGLRGARIRANIAKTTKFTMMELSSQEHPWRQTGRGYNEKFLYRLFEKEKILSLDEIAIYCGMSKEHALKYINKLEKDKKIGYVKSCGCWEILD